MNRLPLVESMASAPAPFLDGIDPWQMGFGERAALVGLLSELKPALSVEIGTAEGGSLKRIAEHSGEVHSFDMVEPQAEARALENVHLHTGDSHALLPKVLEEFAAQGRNVDFALVDGDHSADGAAQDMHDLLSSPAVGRTVIIAHDSMNEEVRRGLERIDYSAWPKVRYVELDCVSGFLFREPFPNELWGGLALIVIDADNPRAPGRLAVGAALPGVAAADGRRSRRTLGRARRAGERPCRARGGAGRAGASPPGPAPGDVVRVLAAHCPLAPRQGAAEALTIAVAARRRIAFATRELHPFAGGGIAPITAALARELAPVADVELFTSARYREAHERSPGDFGDGVLIHFVDEPDGAGDFYTAGHAWSARLYEALAARYAAAGGPDLIEFVDYLAEGFVTIQARAHARAVARATRGWRCGCRRRRSCAASSTGRWPATSRPSRSSRRSATACGGRTRCSSPAATSSAHTAATTAPTRLAPAVARARRVPGRVRGRGDAGPDRRAAARALPRAARAPQGRAGPRAGGARHRGDWRLTLLGADTATGPLGDLRCAASSS